MDYRSALWEFSELLKIGAQSLKKIASTKAPTAEIEGCLSELNDIAKRLQTIGERIGSLSSKP